MAQSDTRPGRPVRLELNAQRVTAAMSFYQALFAWTSKPLHVPPWGSIPLIFNGDRNFGNQFMAMGAFAQPRWLIWFSADIERAESRLQAHGCDVGEGIYQLGDLGRLLDTSDPGGARFSMIEPAAAAASDRSARRSVFFRAMGKRCGRSGRILRRCPGADGRNRRNRRYLEG